MEKKFSVCNIRNLRKKNTVYIINWILYYAWVIVFTTWWTSSPSSDVILGESSRQLMHSSYLIVSAICIFIFKKEWFKKTAYIGAILSIITSILSLIITNDLFNTTTIIILGISLGIYNVSMIIPMVYIMNNTEKFYSIVLSFVLISVFIFLQEIGFLTMDNGIILSFIMLVLSLLPTIWYKEDDLKNSVPKNNYIPKSKNIFYVTILINCLYAIFCKGIGKTYLDSAVKISNLNLYPIHYIGGILGCFIYYLIYRFLKDSNHFTWNFTFSTFIVSIVMFTSSSHNPSYYYISSLLMGIASTMGMINMYYVLGVIGKKYWNHNYVKASIILIGLVGGVSGILAGKFISNFDAVNNYNSLIACTIIVVVILTISPILAKSYFREDWSFDSEKSEVDNDHFIIFKQYNLTNKEIELCNLLIEGYTLRQASIMMNIKENSAIGYQSKIYKKLKINTRKEFVNIFTSK